MVGEKDRGPSLPKPNHFWGAIRNGGKAVKGPPIGGGGGGGGGGKTVGRSVLDQDGPHFITVEGRGEGVRPAVIRKRKAPYFGGRRSTVGWIYRKTEYSHTVEERLA